MSVPATTPCTFVHVRRRNAPVDEAAAPADVLFDTAGHAFHHTRGHGVKKHDQAHHLDPHTKPRLSVSRSDSIAWVADEPFSVAIAPQNPFTVDFPAQSRPDASGAFHVIVSGPPRPGTIGEYKATFTFGTLQVDPDFEIRG